MKKIYMSPAMDIIELKKQTLLAGSAPVLGEDFMDGDDVLAPPGMDFEPTIPGIPSFVFE